ncbi:MAG: ribose-5-phosphate isomerase [Streptosporangiaceae bacterium]
MHVYLGSDHAGFELKGHLLRWLRERGYEPIDCGPDSYEASDDYPPYIMRVAAGVAGDAGSMGVVIGGSGNGEAIAANKVQGIRAVLVWDERTARLGRAHNDGNIISLGARMYTLDQATRLVEIFLTTAFSEEQRHARRLAMIARYEESGELPEPSPGS